MSRITNDTETIGQAINFALVNVASGVLLLVWIAYNMLAKSVPFALLSMVVVPVMAVATTVFLEPGAQSLPQDAQRDGQRQRRAAGEHLGGARSAGVQPGRREHRAVPHDQRRQPGRQCAGGGFHQRPGARPWKRWATWRWRS